MSFLTWWLPAAIAEWKVIPDDSLWDPPSVIKSVLPPVPVLQDLE